MNHMMISVTGHRPQKLGGYGPMAMDKLELFAMHVLEEYTQHDVWFITGMALGWDQAIAVACMELGIPFVAAIPFDGQDSKWPHASRERYRELVAASQESHIVCPGEYASAKMQTRNEWMVDHADRVLALWDGTPGGTGNCVRYAVSCGIPIVQLWDRWKSFSPVGVRDKRRLTV